MAKRAKFMAEYDKSGVSDKFAGGATYLAGAKP